MCMTWIKFINYVEWFLPCLIRVVTQNMKTRRIFFLTWFSETQNYDVFTLVAKIL